MLKDTHASFPTRSPRPETIDQAFELLGTDRSKFANPSELKTAESQIIKLLAVCKTWDLEWSLDTPAGYLVINGMGNPLIMFSEEAILTIARRSGLYLPGKERIYRTGPKADELYCEASCYTRFSTQDTQWVEVSRTFNFMEYADRDMDADRDINNPIITGRWAYLPTVNFTKVSRVLVAKSTLPFLDAFTYFYDVPRKELHAQVLASKAPR